MKWRSLDSKIEALTVKETMSKAHMQVHTNKESHEKQPVKKSGPKFGPSSVPPLTYPPLQLFIAPWPRVTKNYIRHPSPRSREEKDTIPKRRGSRWLTRVPLAGLGTLHGRPHRSSRI
jgi:hypothetical protein